MSLYRVESYHIGTHASHCCVLHEGLCKYGNLLCPVLTGEVKQTRICQDCQSEGIKSLRSKRFKSANLKSRADIARDLSREIGYMKEQLMNLDFEVMEIRETIDELEELRKEYSAD